MQWHPQVVAQASGPVVAGAVDRDAAQFLFLQTLVVNGAASGLGGLAAASGSARVCVVMASLMGSLNALSMLWLVVRRPHRSPIDVVLVPLQGVIVSIMCFLTAGNVDPPAFVSLLQSSLALVQVLGNLIVMWSLSSRVYSRGDHLHETAEGKGEAMSPCNREHRSLPVKDRINHSTGVEKENSPSVEGSRVDLTVL